MSDEQRVDRVQRRLQGGELVGVHDRSELSTKPQPSRPRVGELVALHSELGQPLLRLDLSDHGLADEVQQPVHLLGPDADRRLRLRLQLRARAAPCGAPAARAALARRARGRVGARRVGARVGACIRVGHAVAVLGVVLAAVAVAVDIALSGVSGRDVVTLCAAGRGTALGARVTSRRGARVAGRRRRACLGTRHIGRIDARDRGQPSLQRFEIEGVVNVLAAVLHEVDDRVEGLEEVVAHLRGVGQLAIADLDHDVLEPVRDVADVDEPDHPRRALQRVGVAEHLLDERLVVRLRLEGDHALVQTLQKVCGLFLELGDERAAVEVDHVLALALSRVRAIPGPRRRTPNPLAPTPWPSPRAARRHPRPASNPPRSAVRPSRPRASP